MINKRIFSFFLLIILFGSGIVFTIMNEKAFFQVTEQPVQIRFATWASSPLENMVMDHVIDTFTQKTGIYVERETYVHNYEEMLSKHFREGDSADVFLTSHAIYSYWQSQGWLANVDELVGDHAQYVPVFENTFTTEEAFYAVPKDLSALMLFINQNLLRDAGYSKADVPRTLPEFLEFLAVLQPLLPEGVAALTIDASYENLLSIFYELDPLAVTSEHLEDSQPIREFLVALKQLSEIGALEITNKTLDVHATERFRNGKTVFTFNNNLLYGELQHYRANFSYSVQSLPTIDDKKHTSFIVAGYGVSSQSEHPAEAEQFVQFLSNEAAHYISKSLKTIPARKEIITKEYGEHNKFVNETLSMIEKLPLFATSECHLVFAHFFGLSLPKLIATPEQSPAIFARMHQQIEEVLPFVYRKNVSGGGDSN